LAGLQTKQTRMKNILWVTNKRCQVIYKNLAGGVTRDDIRALNGKAITITPEFDPTRKDVEGTDIEKEVYEMCKNLFQEYTEEATGEQLDDAEQRAMEETANEFNITPKEVEEIYIRLVMSQY